VAQLTNMYYLDMIRRGHQMPYQENVLPLSFVVSSAIFGTQSVVQAKCLSECLEQLTGHQVNVFAYAYFWITLFLFVSLVAVWLYRLTKALEHFEPLFIIPLLQSNYILFATVSGGIYFQEFMTMVWWQWLGFVTGVTVMFYGLFLIAPKSEEAPAEDSTASQSDEKGKIASGQCRSPPKPNSTPRSKSNENAVLFTSPRAKTQPVNTGNGGFQNSLPGEVNPGDVALSMSIPEGQTAELPLPLTCPGNVMGEMQGSPPPGQSTPQPDKVLDKPLNRGKI